MIHRSRRRSSWLIAGLVSLWFPLVVIAGEPLDGMGGEGRVRRACSGWTRTTRMHR